MYNIIVILVGLIISIVTKLVLLYLSSSSNGTRIAPFVDKYFIKAVKHSCYFWSEYDYVRFSHVWWITLGHHRLKFFPISGSNTSHLPLLANSNDAKVFFLQSGSGFPSSQTFIIFSWSLSYKVAKPVFLFGYPIQNYLMDRVWGEVGEFFSGTKSMLCDNQSPSGITTCS